VVSGTGAAEFAKRLLPWPGISKKLSAQGSTIVRAVSLKFKVPDLFRIIGEYIFNGLKTKNRLVC